MIPAKLNELDWSHLEALVTAGREEDDTIEFKRGFKGGDDFSSLTDPQKAAALESLGREVVAFLNTRGGDVVVGIREEAGDTPRASTLEPIANAAMTADRVARGLASLIEPAQTNLVVRAIESPGEEGGGVLVIRVLPSLRAPHRLRRSKECYARRGSESVPMAMDEVQDLTLQRSRLRLEQQELLDRQFVGFDRSDADYVHLTDPIVHLRTVVLPFLNQELSLRSEVLAAFAGQSKPYRGPEGRDTINDVVFRDLHYAWKPILRGRATQSFVSRDSVTQGETFLFARKSVKNNGVVSWEYASRYYENDSLTAHFPWWVGYLASICADIERLAAFVPTILPMTLRVGFRCAGQHFLVTGPRMFQEAHELPNQVSYLPDFAMNDLSDLAGFFEQAQEDLLSLAGIFGGIYSFPPSAGQ